MFWKSGVQIPHGSSLQKNTVQRTPRVQNVSHFISWISLKELMLNLLKSVSCTPDTFSTMNIIDVFTRFLSRKSMTWSGRSSELWVSCHGLTLYCTVFFWSEEPCGIMGNVFSCRIYIEWMHFWCACAYVGWLPCDGWDMWGSFHLVLYYFTRPSQSPVTWHLSVLWF